MEYDRWQVRYHGAAARLNFPFGTRLVDLIPAEPGVVSSAMAREDREAWERLEAEAVDEAYMQELRRQHPDTSPTYLQFMKYSCCFIIILGCFITIL